MTAVIVELSADMFSADVVASTAQRYTGEFFVEIRSDVSKTIVTLSPIDINSQVERLRERFLNDVLDERLRARVRSETGPLQAILVQAALQGARNRSP